MREDNQIVSSKFTISQLDSIIVGILNSLNNRKFLANVDKLFRNVDIEKIFDEEKKIRIYVISKISNLLNSKKIESKQLLLSFLDFEGKYKDSAEMILDDLFNEDVSDSEMSLIDKRLSKVLRFSILDRESDKLSSMITKFQTEDYEDFEEFINDFSTTFDSVNSELRNAKEPPEEQRNDISFNEFSLRMMIEKVIKDNNAPSAKIKSGIRALNDMFDGGFERGRLYVACGLPKG